MSRGVLLTLSAYVLWGLSPLYWKQLDHLAPGEIIAFRMLATVGLLYIGHLVLGTLRRVLTAAADRRARALALLSATLLGANWLMFVWAVNTDRVLEASLGYFMNPLMSVVLGVVVLGERMRRVQWAAVALAGVGVLVLTIDVGTLPWVSLLLAGTFAFYGLIRKLSPLGSFDGLSLEVSAMAPFALGALLVRASAGPGLEGLDSPGTVALLLGTGVVTAAPLLLFASGARLIDLTTVGLLQYVAPTLQFLLGVIVYGEGWSGGQAVGYVVIWVALALFAGEGVWRRQRAPAVIG